MKDKLVPWTTRVNLILGWICVSCTPFSSFECTVSTYSYMVQISIDEPFIKICIPVLRRFQTTSKSTFGRSPPNVNIPQPRFVFLRLQLLRLPSAPRMTAPPHPPAPTDRSSLLTTKTQVADAPCARGISALNALYVGQELWCDELCSFVRKDVLVVRTTKKTKVVAGLNKSSLLLRMKGKVPLMSNPTSSSSSPRPAISKFRSRFWL